MAINSNIYTILADMVKEEFGETIEIYDRSTFVSAGFKLTADHTMTELANAFANNIANKVQLTLNIVRDYDEYLTFLNAGTLPPGGGLEIINHSFYEARSGDFANLTDNQSYDMYVVNKGKDFANYYFDSNAYQINITINSREIEGALQSPEAMSAFYEGKLAYGFNAKRNYANLLRLGLLARGFETILTGTYAATPATNQLAPARSYPLVTLYNAIHNTSITAAGCLYDKDFLRFAVGLINDVRYKMAGYSTAFNPSEKTATPFGTFTPYSDSRLVVNSVFAENVGSYLHDDSYRDDNDQLNYTERVPYWENASSPLTIEYEASSTQTTSVPIIATLFDRYALMTFDQINSVDMTPYNARGMYSNAWFNYQVGIYQNLDANQVIFTLS